MHFPVTYFDATPDDPLASCCEEMPRLLAGRPNAKRYVVIGEKSDCHDEEPLFQTMVATGINLDVVNAAARYPNGESDELLLRPVIVRMGQNVHTATRADDRGQC